MDFIPSFSPSLCGVIGFDDIMSLLSMSERDAVLGNKSRFQLLALHSSVSAMEQRRVFVAPPAVSFETKILRIACVGLAVCLAAYVAPAR